MDSPITSAKAALNVGFIVKLAVGIIVVYAIADALKLTNWLLTPVTQVKSRWFPSSN